MLNLPFKYIYHSHTYRCGHCHGADEEFVLEAIKQGVKILCFTDHSPFPFMSQKGVRMDLSSLDEYVSSLSRLKEKYKDQIEIHIALECEHFHNNDAYLFDYLENKGIEFLILGQHLVILKDTPIWLGNKEYNYEDILNSYADSIIDALDKGLSKYVAHPDLIISSLGIFNDKVEGRLRDIIECAIKHNAYLEFNIHGIYNCNLREFGYPNRYFWEMVKKDYPQAKITIGLDIHELKEYYDNDALIKGLKIIKELGLNIIEKIDIEKELKK